MTVALSPWTMPILRLGMGLFLAAWGMDKLIATEASRGIFSGFYFLDAGAALVQLAGVAEILLGAAVAVGLLRVLAAWAVLAVNLISTAASWRQILDPWGVLGLTDGGTHLFLASIIVMAASIVLVLNRADGTATLDRRLGISVLRRDSDSPPAEKRTI